MEQPGLAFAFELKVEVGKAQELGSAAKGTRRIIPIIGGSFEGPGIKGTIEPGGYDWQLLRKDNVAEVDARYVLKTDDGALITVVNTGLRHGPAAVMERMIKGEEVDPSEYYFRSIPFFETSVTKYEWINRHVFVANGIRKPAVVIIQVWKIL
jgi:hypothetical protein